MGWKWKELEGVLAQETLAKLKGYCVEQGEDNPDVMVWSPEIRGEFTSASAYELILEEEELDLRSKG